MKPTVWPKLMALTPQCWCGCPYPCRYHNVGLLVFFLHDVSDVQLEFTKLNIYFKARGGTYRRLHGLVANLGCLSFCFCW